MATISKVKLELPLLGGNQYRAVVKYRIEFDPIEVEHADEVTYRHTIKIMGDDTDTGDGFDDGHDESIRTLLNEVITAQATPLAVALDMGPYPIAELNEDPELVLGPFRDEVFARVTVRPSKVFDTAERDSKARQQAFEPQ